MAVDKPLQLRAWRLGGAAFGPHDPAPAKPCPGAYRYAVIKRLQNPNYVKEALAQWGAKDQEGVYTAAGLTPKQQEVAFLHYDRCLESFEIATYLGKDAVAIRALLFRANEKLRALAEIVTQIGY